MILSVSRRTDIPSYYSEWFMNRVKEGFVLVRNPMNIHQVSRISLSPDIVDYIVFWSKNPKPMLEKMNNLKDYSYYFQFTLSSYAQDIETALPRKTEIIETFKALSDKIGANKIIWRYDPILLNEKYTIDYHIENFNKIVSRLSGYTQKVTISFIDFYGKITKNMQQQGIRQLSVDDKNMIAKELSAIAIRNGLSIDTCAEDIDLSMYGISHARCIDDRLMQQIIGCKLDVAKDKNQRLECGCVVSVDIGAYNSCSNGCIYCYANYSKSNVEENRKKHNPRSPLLIGDVNESDIVSDRQLKSNKSQQQSIFDI